MFISYSQNFEDALLWRALSAVEKGFFIDVGAGDPVAESVTKAFSSAGWTGINIEPSPTSFALIEQDRPGEVNLRVAVGSEQGTFTYHAVDGGNGLSTGVPEYASNYAAMNWPVTTMTVPLRTLADICDEYAPTDIHFLKIDVEGSERSVLEGADFRRHRPWIVMVEAVRPMALVTPEGELRARPELPSTTHHEWEHLLSTADYRFVLFDGLNRVYVAGERFEQLGAKLASPVSVLDDAVKVETIQALQRAAEENAALALAHEAATRRCDDTVAELDLAQQEIDGARHLVGLLQREVDHYHQELYEGSRALASLAGQLQSTEQLTASLHRQLQQQGAELHLALGQAEHGRAVERELAAVHASKAWRITKPLRMARSMAGRLVRRFR